MHSPETQTYNAELLATRLDDRRFQVVTLGQRTGVARRGFRPGTRCGGIVRKAAGLESISLSVPVGAVLIFTAR